VRKTITIQNEKDLPQLVKEFLRFANGKKKIMLHGEIGAGKTTFVKSFCNVMQTNEAANSPTFSIINEYEYHKGLIYHIDLYRLKTLDEALDIGIEDYLFDDNYCFIEWAELIQELLPDDVVYIYFESTDNGSRILTFDSK
jgi:tRNA threonylcarbamoyladenosine biosynthesis protein TsaE